MNIYLKPTPATAIVTDSEGKTVEIPGFLEFVYDKTIPVELAPGPVSGTYIIDWGADGSDDTGCISEVDTVVPEGTDAEEMSTSDQSDD